MKTPAGPSKGWPGSSRRTGSTSPTSTALRRPPRLRRTNWRLSCNNTWKSSTADPHPPRTPAQGARWTSTIRASRPPRAYLDELSGPRPPRRGRHRRAQGRTTPSCTPDGANALRSLRDLKRLGASWTESAALVRVGLDRIGTLADAEPDALASRLVDHIAADRSASIQAAAELARDTAVGLMVQVSPRFARTGGPGPSEAKALAQVLSGQDGGPGAAGEIDTSLLPDTATLRRLFGDLDDCACYDCMSMSGPNAYYAQLLYFESRNDCAWRRLLKTRPDLVDLEPLVRQRGDRVSAHRPGERGARERGRPPRLDRGSARRDRRLAPRGDPPARHDLSALRSTCVSMSDRSELHAERESSPQPAGAATSWVVRDRATHKRWTLQRVTESLT